MGSPRGEPERRPGEDQVKVTLTKNRWVQRHPHGDLSPPSAPAQNTVRPPSGIPCRISGDGGVIPLDMSETTQSDRQLLARYTRHHAEGAFAEIVRRHIGLVHSAALRQVRSP